MAMPSKVLFAKVVPAASTALSLTTGPASGKVWVINNIKLINTHATTAGSCVVEQTIDLVDYTLSTAELIPALTNNYGNEISSIVMEYGNSLKATTTVTDVIFHILAYGYEMNV